MRASHRGPGGRWRGTEQRRPAAGNVDEAHVKGVMPRGGAGAQPYGVQTILPWSHSPTLLVHMGGRRAGRPRRYKAAPGECGCHDCRDRVGRVVGSRPGGGDADARRPDVEAAPAVREVGLDVVAPRRADGQRDRRRSRRAVARVGVPVARRDRVNDAVADRARHRVVQRLREAAAEGHVGHCRLAGLVVRGHPIDAGDDAVGRSATAARQSARRRVAPSPAQVVPTVPRGVPCRANPWSRCRWRSGPCVNPRGRRKAGGRRRMTASMSMRHAGARALDVGC